MSRSLTSWLGRPSIYTTSHAIVRGFVSIHQSNQHGALTPILLPRPRCNIQRGRDPQNHLYLVHFLHLFPSPPHDSASPTAASTNPSTRKRRNAMWLRYLIPTNVRHGRAATGGEEPHNRPHAAARSAAYPSTPTMTSGRGPFPSSTPQLHQPGTRRNTRRASAPREQAAMRSRRPRRLSWRQTHAESHAQLSAGLLV